MLEQEFIVPSVDGTMLENFMFEDDMPNLL